MISIIRLAAEQRRTLGFITVKTWALLAGAGYTRADVESALSNLENTNG